MPNHQPQESSRIGALTATKITIKNSDDLKVWQYNRITSWLAQWTPVNNFPVMTCVSVRPYVGAGDDVDAPSSHLVQIASDHGMGGPLRNVYLPTLEVAAQTIRTRFATLMHETLQINLTKSDFDAIFEFEFEFEFDTTQHDDDFSFAVGFNYTQLILVTNGRLIVNY